jgi:hypothetical protein
MPASNKLVRNYRSINSAHHLNFDPTGKAIATQLDKPVLFLAIRKCLPSLGYRSSGKAESKT